MKRTTFAILLTILITLSCIFASCNASDSILGQDGQSQTEDTSGNYSSLIKELEDQILELKQDQYISDSKRNEEISRLEALILELKQSNKDSDTESEAESSEDTEESESVEDTEANTTDSPSPTGKFLYSVENGEATITGFTGNDAVLTLPSAIDGYAVTRISDDAFNSDTLESVIIPEGVVKIGWFAFKDCSALRTVTIPESVESIGYSAFPTRVNGFSIICSADSFAARYAESYGISVTPI